jgi:hypothetical protein
LDTHRRRTSVAFALGFTSAVLIGAIALAILSFATPQPAHASGRTIDRMTAFEPAVLPGEAPIY